MKKTYFVIAYRGSHLFDITRLADRVDIEEFTKELQVKFPVEQGYTIYRNTDETRMTTTLIQKP